VDRRGNGFQTLRQQAAAQILVVRGNRFPRSAPERYYSTAIPETGTRKPGPEPDSGALRIPLDAAGAIIHSKS
jgi:hypothetical protein